MNERVYSPEDQDLIYEWSYNWLQLIELINNITGTDQAPWSPLVPTELDELEYQRLRFWLIDHQARFTPLWREFYQSHDWAITQSNAAKEGDYHKGILKTIFCTFMNPRIFIGWSGNLNCRVV